MEVERPVRFERTSLVADGEDEKFQCIMFVESPTVLTQFGAKCSTRLVKFREKTRRVK